MSFNKRNYTKIYAYIYSTDSAAQSIHTQKYMRFKTYFTSDYSMLGILKSLIQISTNNNCRITDLHVTCT